LENQQLDDSVKPTQITEKKSSKIK
jgi:hypothetical protein